jgi:hypothetical protein
LSVNKWSEVMCVNKGSDAKWSVVKWKWREELMSFMWSASVLKCSEAKRATVKS